MRWAREVFTANEFGLGVFEIVCMILTHQDRLDTYENLWIDCAGDEYAPFGDGAFFYAPYFRFYGSPDFAHWDGAGVEFGPRWVGDADGRYGSVSAFLPQQP